MMMMALINVGGATLARVRGQLHLYQAEGPVDTVQNPLESVERQMRSLSELLTTEVSREAQDCPGLQGSCKRADVVVG